MGNLWIKMCQCLYNKLFAVKKSFLMLLLNLEKSYPFIIWQYIVYLQILVSAGFNVNENDLDIDGTSNFCFFTLCKG